MTRTPRYLTLPVLVTPICGHGHELTPAPTVQHVTAWDGWWWTRHSSTIRAGLTLDIPPGETLVAIRLTYHVSGLDRRVRLHVPLEFPEGGWFEQTEDLHLFGQHVRWWSRWKKTRETVGRRSETERAAS